MDLNDKQIESLAREYAELTDGSPADIAYITAIAENTIHFLLRRYCLVEKEELINHYNKAKSGIKPQYLEAFQFEVGVTKVLESLFPEIAKEVEG